MTFDERALAEADAKYTPFAPFRESADGARINLDEWQRYSDNLRTRVESADPDALARAVTITIREASVETGAIEGLYPLTRGVTYSVAVEAAAWQASLLLQGDLAPRLFQAQLEVYELVMDVATKSRPVDEPLIRSMQQILTGPQSTMRVLTPSGYQEQEFPKGAYKSQPNHPWREDGELAHAYAPVLDTPPEMERFVNELRSPGFDRAHPVLQAAFAHYGLVAIHPFADGNGRVARALASIYLYRSDRIPLLVYANQNADYIAALEAADSGDRAAFPSYVYGRGLAAMGRLSDLLRVASLAPTEESVALLRRMTTSAGGLTYPELDSIAQRLSQIVMTQIQAQLTDLGLPPTIKGTPIGYGLEVHAPPDQGYRQPVSPGVGAIGFSLEAVPPASGTAMERFFLFVAVDADRYATFSIERETTAEHLEIPLSDVHPEPSEDFNYRLRLFVQAAAQQALMNLAPQVRQSLEEKGYLNPE